MPILESTFASIMADDRVARVLHSFVPGPVLQHLEHAGPQPLSLLDGKLLMPWGGYFNAGEFAAAVELAQELAKDSFWEPLPLWPDTGELFTGDDSQPPVLLAPRRPEKEPAPAALICPGGGYEFVSMVLEGLWYAARLRQAGYVPFVLRYRVAPFRHPEPQLDLALAVLHLRANAGRYGIRTDNLLCVGSSAGGHLCALEAARHQRYAQEVCRRIGTRDPALAAALEQQSARPDRLCLCYPVVTFDPAYRHQGSFEALTGGDESLAASLSVENCVGPDFPKTYLWCCDDDALVPPENTLLLQKALEKAGVASRVRCFTQGGHGCGLAAGTSAQGWMEDMLDFMA